MQADRFIAADESGATPAPAFRRSALLALVTVLALLGGLPALTAREGDRDTVAQWTVQRMARQARIDRLPRAGARFLVIPIGAPPPASPTALDRRNLQAVIEKLDEYSGPRAPAPIDAVLFEINATGGLGEDELDDLQRLVDMLKIRAYPAFAWVHSAALDEAAWIALGCDRIYVDATAAFGGAPPDPLRDPAERYDPTVMQLTAAKARFAADFAGDSGYNGDLAAAMTDGSIELFRVTIDGRPTVLTAATIAEVRDKRPGAAVTVGAVYKKSGDRLLLRGAALQASELGLVGGAIDTRAALWPQLGLTQVQTIELQLRAAAAPAWRSLAQLAALLAVALLALFLLVCELWMETRGWALITAGGLMLAYLIWAAFAKPMGPAAIVLFLAGAVLLVVELFRPARRILRGVVAFTALGLSLGLTLVPELPGLDPDWRTRHLRSEFWPAVGDLALLIGGSALAAVAVGLLAMLRLRQTARYRRRWRKRYENWDDTLFLTLQAQLGKTGRTLTAIVPPAVATAETTPVDPLAADAADTTRDTAGADGVAARAAAFARRRETAPDREPRFDIEGQSAGTVVVDGRPFAATCTGSIAADQPVVVVDCTEERLIVRHLPEQHPSLPPWQTHSKYEATPATKYTEVKAAPPSETPRYAELEQKLAEEPRRYRETPPDERPKYPTKIDDTKYNRERKHTGGSKYRPEDDAQKAEGSDPPAS